VSAPIARRASELFGDEHATLRRTVRAFVEKEITLYVDAWEEAGQIPRTFWQRRLPVERGARRGDGALPVRRRGVQRARALTCRPLAHALRYRDPEAALPARHRRRRDGVHLCISEPGTGSDMAAVDNNAS
jgi:alkylation response protein AidB-like acyl-CoA dehydrogenase